MKVLVDSSVWVEFFHSKPAILLSGLETLIGERRVVTCLPIRTEILSGNLDARARRTVERAFDAMEWVDLDWNSVETWRLLVDIGLKARYRKVSVPGIVDRMILACGLQAKVLLWTLDKKLLKLAQIFHQPLYE